LQTTVNFTQLFEFLFFDNKKDMKQESKIFICEFIYG
jgi:hypothetical protein